jgi:hypothetical protein
LDIAFATGGFQMPQGGPENAQDVQIQLLIFTRPVLQSGLRNGLTELSALLTHGFRFHRGGSMQDSQSPMTA